MKLAASKENILEGLQKIQSGISSRNTLPILNNVLLRAKDGSVQLTATDLEVSVQTTFEAKVAREGATTLPARRLFSIIKELPASDIELTVDDKDTATIKAGSSVFKIIGISDEEFPPIPQFEGQRTFTLDQGLFKKMLAATYYSSSNEESRYVLNGVLLSFKDDKVTVVATDGRRMALFEQEVEFPESSSGDFIIPNKTIVELVKTLGAEGPVKIMIGDNQAAFAYGNLLIITKLIDGTFPNFRQVIPSQCEERVSLEREQLLNAVRRVSLVNDKTSSVTLAFEKDNLTISTSSAEVGEASESMAIKYRGKAMGIAFNPDFMMDCLRNLTTDEVALEFSDELSPGVMKCDAPFLYVLMPMRIR
ncbi:MAG TPA: DNA polymerase III subunit beta [Kiritimatiellia bacterium]|nr:DNA polymerase III subunit beta [Kiritimatiellia bacterium]HMP33938.1 DNA polymerase III subunit beta [Kiritimatiellia bacterium]